MQRRYAIGDIRGELGLLDKLLDKIGPSQEDSLTFLGSYLGPGPNSKGVVDRMLELKKKTNCRFLRGCYEWVFGFCIQDRCPWEYAQAWGEMHGERVFESYADESKLVVLAPTGTDGKSKPVRAEIPLRIPSTHIEFMARDMYQWYEDDIHPYILTHSGGHPALFGGSLQREEQTVFDERDWWKQDGRQIFGKTVIFSHRPFPQPFRGPGKLGIDLGAGFGGKLCAFELSEEKFAIVG